MGGQATGGQATGGLATGGQATGGRVAVGGTGGDAGGQPPSGGTPAGAAGTPGGAGGAPPIATAGTPGSAGDAPGGAGGTGGFWALGGAGGASGSHIGLDIRHGYYNSDTRETNTLAAGEDTEFLSAIQDDGYQLVPLSSFESQDLKGLAAVILAMPFDNAGSGLPAQGYSTGEISALLAFVAAGGGALVHGDGGSGGMVDNLNALVSNWGVEFSAYATGGNGALVTSFLSHPVTDGLNSVGFDYYLPILSFVPPALDLTSGTPDIMAVYDDGAGAVVMLGDRNHWSDPGTGADYDIDHQSTRLLLRNILAYITQ